MLELVCWIEMFDVSVKTSSIAPLGDCGDSVPSWFGSAP